MESCGTVYGGPYELEEKDLEFYQYNVCFITNDHT